MACTVEVVKVTVRSLAGDVLLGPQFLSRVGMVAELRTKLVNLRHSRTGVDRVLLVNNGDILQDETMVEAELVECTAMFQHEELCKEERRSCINSLSQAVCNYRSQEVLRPRQMRMWLQGRVRALKVFSDFSDVARADAQVVKEAVHCHWQCLEFAHERFRADAALVLQACKHNTQALALASAKLRVDKQFVLRLVRRDGRAVRFASPELCRDREFMLEALWRNPTALRNVTFTVPDDLLLLLAEDMSEPLVLESLGREEAFRQVHADGLWLAEAIEFQDDKAIVLAAVEQNPEALRFTTLVDDRDVVLMAVRSNGKLLEFASEELRRDHEVVLAAICSNPRARRFAIDKPLFDFSDSKSLTQVETTAQQPNKRAGIKRSKANWGRRGWPAV